MGEAQLLTTAQTAKYLGITTKQFKRLRHDSKDNNAQLIQSLKAISKGKLTANFYKISDVKRVKKALNLITDMSIVFSSKEAAEYLGIKPHTFQTYREGKKRNAGSLAADVAELKQANCLKLENFYFKADIKALAEKNRKVILTCAYENCDNTFVRRTNRHKFCSDQCKNNNKNSLAIHKPNPKPKPKMKKQKNDRNRVVTKLYASYIKPAVKTDYETGLQTTTAVLCACGRGSINPFTKMCSTCQIESNYKMTTKGKRMRGI